MNTGRPAGGKSGKSATATRPAGVPVHGDGRHGDRGLHAAGRVLEHARRRGRRAGGRLVARRRRRLVAVQLQPRALLLPLLRRPAAAPRCFARSCVSELPSSTAVRWRGSHARTCCRSAPCGRGRTGRSGGHPLAGGHPSAALCWVDAIRFVGSESFGGRAVNDKQGVRGTCRRPACTRLGALLQPELPRLLLQLPAGGPSRGGTQAGKNTQQRGGGRALLGLLATLQLALVEACHKLPAGRRRQRSGRPCLLSWMLDGTGPRRTCAQPGRTRPPGPSASAYACPHGVQWAQRPPGRARRRRARCSR